MLGSFRNRRAGVLIWAADGRARRRPRRLRHRRRRRPHQPERRPRRRPAGRPPTSTSARCSRSSARSTHQIGRDADRWPRRGSTASTAWCSAGSSTTPPSTTRPPGSASPTGDDTVRDQVMATPGLPRARRQVRPRHLHLRPRAHRPAPGRVRGAAPPRSHPRAARRPACRPPATLPDTEALTVLDFLGEKRSFDWIRLDAALLPEPVPAPTDADLAAEHDAHAADRYTRPETRQITYASVTPESARRRRSRSPRPSCAPPTTPTPTTTRPPSAGRSTASASAPPRRPRPPRRASTPARSTSTRSPPSAASSPRTSTRASSPPTRLPPEARDAVFGARRPRHRRPGRHPARAVALPHQRGPRRQAPRPSRRPRPSSRRTGRSRRRSGRSTRTPRTSRT